MNKVSTQKGYTAIELMIVIGGALSLCAAGVGLYVLIHFIAKMW